MGGSWKPSIAITLKTKTKLSWLSYIPPKKQLLELKEREKGLTGTPRGKPQPPKLLSYTTRVRYLPHWASREASYSGCHSLNCCFLFTLKDLCFLKHNFTLEELSKPQISMSEVESVLPWQPRYLEAEKWWEQQPAMLHQCLKKSAKEGVGRDSLNQNVFGYLCSTGQCSICSHLVGQRIPVHIKKS